MKTPVGLVTAALAVAILLAVSFLIATGTRGEAPAFGSSAGELEVRTVARGLVNPWALAFLPDGTMLVTERPGRMRIVTSEGQVSPPLKGVPEVWASGQGGLLDVVADKSFAQNKTVYFCFAERTERRWTHRGRARQTQRRQGPARRRQDHLPPAGAAVIGQSLRLPHRAGRRRQSVRHAGRAFRLPRSGAKSRQSSRQGDPDRAGRFGAVRQPVRRPRRRQAGDLELRPSQPQSLAIHPASGELWEIEHGPRGGDEVNLIGKGKNYGWPVIGYGIDYSGAKIHDATAKDGMEQPLKYWVPSIAPSGMAFYTGKLFPKWNGSLFTGALRGAMLVRLTLNGNAVTSEERLLENLHERIRDVRQGPDGALWLLTDSSNGRVLRVAPAAK